MPIVIQQCADALRAAGLRHHVDHAERVIRLIYATVRYRNRRDEHLAIITLSLSEMENVLRLSIERAFDAGPDPAAACLAACRCAAMTPLVAAEYDPDFDNLRFVIDVMIEQDEPLRVPLESLINRLVDAAEVWQGAFVPTTHSAEDGCGGHERAA